MVPEPETPAKKKTRKRLEQPGMLTCNACHNIYPRRALLATVVRKIKTATVVCGSCAHGDRKAILAKGQVATGMKRLRVAAAKARLYDRKMRR